MSGGSRWKGLEPLAEPAADRDAILAEAKRSHAGHCLGRIRKEVVGRPIVAAREADSRGSDPQYVLPREYVQPRLHALVIDHHPHRPLADLGCKLVRRLAHTGSTFSGVGASGKPGAVQ